jgi:hypothetical protein
MRDIRFLGHASKHLSGLRAHGQHRLHEKPPSAFVADLSHATDLVTMRKIDVARILHQQDDWRGSGLFSRLLKVGVHQGSKAHELRNEIDSDKKRSTSAKCSSREPKRPEKMYTSLEAFSPERRIIAREERG